MYRDTRDSRGRVWREYVTEAIRLQADNYSCVDAYTSRGAVRIASGHILNDARNDLLAHLPADKRDGKHVSRKVELRRVDKAPPFTRRAILRHAPGVGKNARKKRERAIARQLVTLGFGPDMRWQGTESGWRAILHNLPIGVEYVAE